MRVGRIIELTVVLVLLGTWAYAADCNNGGRYEDNLDGTVTDCRTGMIWLKNATCKDTSNGIVNPYGFLLWYDAMSWVAGLGNGLCGLTDGSSAGDWRLPTKTEWMAMVEYARYHGYIDPPLTNGAGTGHWTAGDAFSNVLSDDYWSSTTYAPNTAYVWSVSMSVGGVVYEDKRTNIYVWPVRGGQSGSFGSLFIE